MQFLVDVHWNTHKKCFSLRPKVPSKPPCGFTSSPKGSVFYNTGPFLLHEPSFHVSEKGRQWVLKHGRKTVHATISGRLDPLIHDVPPLARQVRYNPYECGDFVTLDGVPVWNASRAYFVDNKVWII